MIEGLSRTNQMKERLDELADKPFKNTQSEEGKEGLKGIKNTYGNFWMTPG